MRRLVLGSLLLASTLTAARPDSEALRALAGACVAAQIESCDTENFGTLETGDCLFDNGTRFDTFDFQGQAGQLVNIMVRPLSPSYTRPFIALVSPAGDVVEPPIVHGGSGGASIWYQLSSTGRWRIGVSSDDVFAGGNYVVHFDCEPGNPSQPQSCVSQELLCGQEGRWNLSADSCRFSSVNKAFASWRVYGVKGDVLNVVQESLDFEPLFGIYDERAGELLKSSSRANSARATMVFTFPETKWYEILTTSVQENRGGDFNVSITCNRSGCTFPYLLAPIPTIIAPHGQPATIPFQVNAVGGFTAMLRQDLVPIATSTTSSITTPPVTSLQRYILHVDNACGGWSSNPFIVMSDRLSKRRTARR